MRHTDILIHQHSIINFCLYSGISYQNNYSLFMEKIMIYNLQRIKDVSVLNRKTEKLSHTRESTYTELPYK